MTSERQRTTWDKRRDALRTSSRRIASYMKKGELESLAQRTILMMLLRKEVCQLAGERDWKPAMRSYRRAHQRVADQTSGVEIARNGGTLAVRGEGKE